MADGMDLSDIVRRTVQANAKFYKGWMDLSFEYFRGISEIFGGEPASSGPVQEMDSGAGTLVMEGEAGKAVRGSFLVSNDMDKPVSCAFVGSDFKDPRGATVAATPIFEPPSLELRPGEERVVQLTIAIDEKLSPGVGYAGEIFIRGMDGFSVPVVLRRQHEVRESPLRDQSDVSPSAAEPDASRSSPRRASANKGSGKKTRH